MRLQDCAAFVALFATVGVAHLAAATIHVNTNTSMLLDAFGRERYFHGVNVVYKAVRAAVVPLAWQPCSRRCDAGCVRGTVPVAPTAG